MKAQSEESDVIALMVSLGVLEEDLEEQFIRGSGPGGQKINKVSACVQLRHRPSGISVRCERYRSQARNRLMARRMLCEKLVALQKAELLEKDRLTHLRRQRNRRRSKGAKEKMLREKRTRASTKKLRRSPARDE